MTIEEAVAAARAEERERCARALELEKERVLEEEGAFIGELAMYDVCALVVRQLAGAELN